MKWRDAIRAPIGFLGIMAFVVPASIHAATDAPNSVESDVQRSQMMGRLSEASPTRSTLATAEPSPGDIDLGEQVLLTAPERYRSLSLYGGATQFFTSDASLVADDIGADWFTMMQAGVSWTPHLGGGLYAEAVAQQDLFRYAQYSQLSFNSTTLSSGLIYVVRSLGDLSLSARYGWNLLTNASASDRIFDEQVIRLGLQKPWTLAAGHTVWVGTNAAINLAGSPGYALRDQFSGSLIYEGALTSRVSLTGMYQVGYYPFREGGRADWNQFVSGGVTTKIVDWFSVSVLVSGVFNHSNESYYNYSVLNVGGGLNATFRF